MSAEEVEFEVGFGFDRVLFGFGCAWFFFPAEGDCGGGEGVEAVAEGGGGAGGGAEEGGEVVVRRGGRGGEEGRGGGAVEFEFDGG